MTLDIQTPRRSKRYQPLVAGPSSSKHDRHIPVTFLGEAVYSRVAKADDLHDEDDVDLEEEEGAETHFYEAFSKQMKHQNVLKRKSDNDNESEEFRVGDAVFVKTQSKLPSVGVIVSMWEVQISDEEVEKRVYQKVKVHWFLRPNELPSVRAKRAHREVCAISSGWASQTI